MGSPTVEPVATTPPQQGAGAPAAANNQNNSGAAQTTTNAPAVGVQSVTTTTTTTGCTNTVVLNATYKVKLNVGTYNLDDGVITTTGASKLPYVLVYASFSQPDSWTVIKTSTTTGGIVIPLENIGYYRLYIKEPRLTFQANSTFDIPYHMNTDGTASTHQVQPFLGLRVESANNCAADATTNKLTPPFTVTTYLPNTLSRAANLYPTTGQTFTLTQQNSQSTLTLNGFTTRTRSSATAAFQTQTENTYRITFQLWSDCSRAYGHLHTRVQNSTHRTILENFYREAMTVSGNSRRLTFRFGTETRDREIFFDEGGTFGARQTLSFSSQTNMTASEAIRRIHPDVWDYWVSAMQTLNLTYSKIGSAWRPHIGSTYHRYSVALDFNDTRGMLTVPNPNYHSGSPPGSPNAQPEIEEEITITFRRDLAATDVRQDCNPSTALSANSSTAPTARDKRITLSKNILNHVATGKLGGQLGWTGGPWTLNYNQVGITNNTTRFITTDNTHKHHIHLTVGTEQV